MSETTNLALPFIQASQAQKHVTHNDGLRQLDALVHLNALSRAISDPPLSPTEGSSYLIANGATGDWLAKEENIATYQDGSWAFFPLKQGLVAWVDDEGVLTVWDGANWIDLHNSQNALNNLPTLGVNATADSINKLSVSSSAILFNHDGGDIRQKLNKNAASDTASLLFQNNFEGRAEIGLAGDDDFHFKVSSDGSAFHEAIVIDKDTGFTSFPNNTGIMRRLDYMGEFVNAPNNGIQRFNMRLNGVDLAQPAGIYALIIGYAYGSGKALDMVFTGYNYPPLTGLVYKQHIVDRAGTNLATGFTKTANSIYIWFESNSYFVNGSLQGMKVEPGSSFDPSAGFDLILTNQGVDVTD